MTRVLSKKEKMSTYVKHARREVHERIERARSARDDSSIYIYTTAGIRKTFGKPYKFLEDVLEDPMNSWKTFWKTYALYGNSRQMFNNKKRILININVFY